jgi:hypothetical protein
MARKDCYPGDASRLNCYFDCSGRHCRGRRESHCTPLPSGSRSGERLILETTLIAFEISGSRYAFTAGKTAGLSMPSILVEVETHRSEL